MLCVGTGSSEFGDPESAVSTGDVGLLNVFLEVSVVGGRVIPVDWHEVNIAVTIAGIQEVGQPSQTFRGSS